MTKSKEAILNEIITHCETNRDIIFSLVFLIANMDIISYYRFLYIDLRIFLFAIVICQMDRSFAILSTWHNLIKELST
jgi:hypothetical protein